MVMILDNSFSADIPIVMPKPDGELLSRDEFSYSNLYSFDYDVVAGSAAASGVSSASVKSSLPPKGNASGDNNSVSMIGLVSMMCSASQRPFSALFLTSTYFFMCHP
jgi:hypothetical protein